MTKEEYLALASEKYDELQALKKNDNFYDYEKGFEKLMKDLGRTLLEKSISEFFSSAVSPLGLSLVGHGSADHSLIKYTPCFPSIK